MPSTCVWKGDGQATAQVTHVTPATVEIGDTFTLTINKKDITVTATAATVENVVNLFVTAIGTYDNDIAEWAEVSASAGTTDGETTHLILTGPIDGKPFTVSATTGDAGNLAVSVVETVAGDPGLNEQQRITIAGTANGGTFTLTYGANTTANIAYNANAATVQTALTGLASLGANNATVTGTGPWTVEFVGSLAKKNAALISGDGTNVTKVTGEYAILVNEIQSASAGQNEIQRIALGGTPSGGNFTVTYAGDTTGNIAYNANAATVVTALESLDGIGSGDVDVTSVSTGVWDVEFQGALARTNVQSMSANGAGVTGSTVTISTVTNASPKPPYTFRFSAISPSDNVTVGAEMVDSGSNVYGRWTSRSFPYDATVAEVLDAFYNGSVSSPTWAPVGSVNIVKESSNPPTYLCQMWKIDPADGSPYGTVNATSNKVDVGEDPIAEVQYVIVQATGGTYTLTFQGQTSANIAYSANAATVESAIEALSNVGSGKVAVTGNAGGPYTVTFDVTVRAPDGLLIDGADLEEMTANTTNLTGVPANVYTVQEFVAGVNEIQALKLLGSPLGGTFTLTYGANTTAGLAYNISAADLETALTGLDSIGANNVDVSGSAGGPWNVEFIGSFEETDVDSLSGNTDSLSGATILVDVLQESVKPTDEVQTITLDGSPTGGTFTLTYGNTTGAITYNASAAGVQNALEALADIAVGDIEVVGASGGPWTVTFRGTLAGTDVNTISGNAASLTSTGNQALALSNITTATGQYNFDNPENWSGGAVPVDGDTVVFELSDRDCLYGLSQANITPAAVVIKANYTGKIGLPYDTGSYIEYRERYLTLGVSGDTQTITTTIGEGSGTGSSRIMLNTGTAPVDMLVLSSGTAEGDVPAILWKGTSTTNVVRVYKGSFGAGVFAGESAVIEDLDVGYRNDQDSDSEVYLGRLADVDDINQSGGSLIVMGEAGDAIETIVQTGGTSTINGTDGVDSLIVRGGTCFYNSTGTLGGNPVVSGTGILDFSQDMRAKTVTNPIEVYGDNADVRDPFKVVTSLVVDYNETTRIPSLGSNIKVTRGAPT